MTAYFNMSYSFLLILLFNTWEINCWRIYHRGRFVGGNLGDPYIEENLLHNEHIKEKWFTQTLDHFHPTSTETWQQRYFVNEKYYNSSNSPVFLMIGGEGKASEKWMVNATWIEYAKQFGALCFQVEHRYYGKSHPTVDLSTKSLQYLTSEQALADLANFIGAMNSKYFLTERNKWIAFGGSYSGSLAAWLRLKYPHLVHGSMSASGPLLAKIDFQEFLQIVANSLSTYGDDCISAIQEGTSQIELSLYNQVGQQSINEKFKLCDPIENSIGNIKDIANFYATLSDNFAGVVQYNKDNRGNVNKEPANITIETVCTIMTDKNIGAPINRLASVNNLLLEAYNQSCMDYKYDKMISSNANISWYSEVAEGGRQWIYQTCTEFAFFQSSSYKPSIFGNYFPVEFFIQQCMDIFGNKFNSTFIETSVKNTNNMYGALNIEVSNVVFVQGSIDPWHALGITKTLNQEAPAIYIEGTAHCANMYPQSKTDLPQLKAARIEIANYIDNWIRLH